MWIEPLKDNLINGQGRAEYASIAYGKSTIGRSGCAAIACYNAMILSGRSMPFEEVIAYFEGLFKRGLGWLASGLLGASPLEMRLFLRKYKVPFRTVWSMRSLRKLLCSESVQQAGDRSERQPGGKPASGVLILTYWNKPVLKYGYHAVAVDCRCSGDAPAERQFTVYNRYNNSAGPERVSDIGSLMEGDRRFIRAFFIPC